MGKLSKGLLNLTLTSKETAVVEVRTECDSNREVARRLGMPRRTVDRIVNRVLARARETGLVGEVTTPKILCVDIETAPSLSYLWSLWPRGGVSHFMQESPTYMVSWAAKWLDGDEVYHDALCNDPDYKPGMEFSARMLNRLWDLLDETDFVVAHNGDRFDIRHINTAFLIAGFDPPSPYRTIDTLKVVRRTFAFDSNRLDYLLRRLFGRTKADSGGFDTWRLCLLGDMERWDQLVKYNIADVQDLEDVYKEVRAWDKSHPSVATTLTATGEPCCTVCGSENLTPTGRTQSTNVSIFPVLRCGDCGSTVRGRRNMLTVEERRKLLVKAK